MKKDILALLSLALIIAVLIHGTNIQSVDEYYLTHIDDITPAERDGFLSVFAVIPVLQNYDELDKPCNPINTCRKTALYCRKPNMC